MKRLVIALLPTLAAGIAPAAPPPEPEVMQRVIEDDGVRIEELRVRGRTQRIVVQSKVGEVRPYQILLSDEPMEQRRSAGGGQRVWQILSF